MICECNTNGFKIAIAIGGAFLIVIGAGVMAHADHDVGVGMMITGGSIIGLDLASIGFEAAYNPCCSPSGGYDAV